jgi:hypothetical protein
MPKNKNRDYDEEAKYHATPEQVARRVARNRARRKALREGKVKKGDDKEVHHVGAKRTGSLDDTPTRVVSKKTNRKIQPKRS